MRNKIILIFVGIFLLCACSNKKTDIIQAPKGRQILAGQIKNAANQIISVRIFDGATMSNSIDTTLDKNGNFHIVIKDTTMIICQIIINKTAVLPVVLTGNDSLYFEASFPNLLSNVEIQNCTYAPELIDYLSQMHDFLKFQDSTIKANGNINRNDTAKINAIRKVLLDKKKVVELYVQKYVEEKPASPVNILLAQELYPTNGMEFWDTTYLATLTTMYNAFLQKYPNEKYTATLMTQIQSWKASLEEYQIFKQKSAIYGGKHFNIAVGEMAPDIQMKNPDGKIIKLSDLKGKYVLVDFWASWCGPCRKENPNVVRIYNQYKNKGFTIFSVSLDKKYDDWMRAIKQDQLTWANHVCDFDGWESFIAKIYKVNSIPFTVLLDKSGKIIALNLRGQQLEQKLISLLGN